jgi:hypothetical protein
MLTSIRHGHTGATVLRLAGVLDVGSRDVHRAREQFGPHAHSVNFALMFVRDHLMAWSMRDKIAVASTVATVFAENALSYTRSGFDIRLEGTTDEVFVAVSDSSPTLAVRRERPLGACPGGLDIVSALCHRWGNTPTSTGKAVWARIGADDTFAGITGLLQQVGHAAS